MNKLLNIQMKKIILSLRLIKHKKKLKKQIQNGVKLLIL